eukprot:m.38337 g.38337  ORF g.38337 m.38337 type:complete len:275 (+) comp10208_c0_seq1:102-926(+)
MSFRFDCTVLCCGVVLHVIGLLLTANCNSAFLPNVTYGLGVSLLLLWAAAVVMCWRVKSTVGADNYSTLLPHWTILLGVVAVGSTSVVRLFDARHFGVGSVCGFAFGEKGNSDINNAFVPEFNSFGHCIQGALVILHASRVFKAWSSHPKLHILLKWIICIVSCAFAIYPTYNLFKRGIKSKSLFASSSYPQNNFEWLVGAGFGIPFGVLLPILLPAIVTCKSPSSMYNEEKHPADDGTTQTRFVNIQKFIGGVLTVVGLVGLIFTFATYNNSH